MRSVVDLGAPAARYRETIPESAQERRYFAVLGDTQRTSYWECRMGREVNDASQRRLLSVLAKQRPEFLVLVGDLVFDGAAPEHWSWFDSIMDPVRRAGIPVLPLLGNHEYWGSEEAFHGHLRKRFPIYERSPHHSSSRYGDLALIRLDSNAAEMPRASWQRQAQWLGATLAELDADAGVRAVFVFTHHPPYTNSPWVEDDAVIARDILPHFEASSKTLALISGHAHGYEHFVVRGKHFIITAGGGGPRPEELRRVHADAYREPAPRPLHYLLVHPESGGVRIEAWGFKGKDGKEGAVDRLDAFEVPFVKSTDRGRSAAAMR